MGAMKSWEERTCSQTASGTVFARAANKRWTGYDAD